jgi:hypothetical protein
VSWGPEAVRPEAAARVRALVSSGRIHPLRPLASGFALPPAAAFERVGRVLFEATQALLGEALEHPVPLVRDTPGLVEVLRAELAAGRGLGFTRLDVLSPREDPVAVQLLEVQAGDPSAMGFHDALAVALGEPQSLMPAHRRAFEALTPKRRIAFVVLKGSVVETDHRLLAEHYAAHGWEASCVDPRELRFEQGELRAAGRPVDAVFRDALDELFCGEFAVGGQALLAAVRAGAVVVMNPFVAALADDKSLLEALSTPGRWGGETAAVLAAHVPWTRVVRPREVEWEGARVSLEALLRGRRDALVLKPVDGFGGYGVVVGPFAAAAEWAAAVDAALAKPGSTVVQRYHPLPRARVPLLDGADVRWEEAFVVHSLWFCPGLAGAFCRASARPVVNVHQGGGLTPVFFRP